MFLIWIINLLFSPSSYTMSLSQYNPFFIKKASEYSAKGLELQEAIFYAESRFSSILNDLRKVDDDRKYWSQKVLHRELVTTIIFIL